MKYSKIVEALDRTLYLIGKQGISDRATQETAGNSYTLWNLGNSLEILWQVSHCYLLMYEHIHLLLRKDFSYMGATSQNELIDIIAKYIIQIWLTEEIREIKCRTSVYVNVYICICICVCIFIYVIYVIYIYIYIYILYIYIHTYMYLFTWYVKTDRKIFCILSFWNVLRCCPFFHLFDTHFQNSPYHPAMLRLSVLKNWFFW